MRIECIDLSPRQLDHGLPSLGEAPRLLVFSAALCNLHPPSCENNDNNEFRAEISCTSAGDPHISQQTVSTVKARKSGSTVQYNVACEELLLTELSTAPRGRVPELIPA